MGMYADALEDANALLARRRGGHDPGRAHLGHLVVSRLAARHGLEVELDSVAGEGVLARVTMPAHLVEPTAHGAHPIGGAPRIGPWLGTRVRPTAGQDEGRDGGGGDGAPRSGRAASELGGGGPVAARSDVRSNAEARLRALEAARSAAGGAPGTGDGSEAVVPPGPETTPSGFRRRVPKRPAAPRGGATAEPADRPGGCGPCPPSRPRPARPASTASSPGARRPGSCSASARSRRRTTRPEGPRENRHPGARRARPVPPGRPMEPATRAGRARRTGAERT